MKHLPIFLDISQQHCVVIGGGQSASRKISLLLKYGAHVCVIAPDLSPSLARLVAENQTSADEHNRATSQLQHIAEHCALETLHIKLQSARLVIAATKDAATNLDIASCAKALNIPCHVADNPEASTFFLPSIVDRDPIQIAISSGGASPILSRLLRDRIEAFVPVSYRVLGKMASEFRTTVKEKLQTARQRKQFWERALHGRVAELVLAGQPARARSELINSLEYTSRNAADPLQTDVHPEGEVALVGAGPGDAELLTLRALRLIQSADVLVYDRLVSQRIMDLRRTDTRIIYAGKARSKHTMVQGSINELLVSLAREGNRVVRLKGGDPFIFGRGGEEIETLASNNIPFQVVPGITAASGCAAFSGIPLTHRDHAQSCVFMTGHLKSQEINLDWSHLRDPSQTIVFYMGLIGLEKICENLIKIGRLGDTPAALVEQGTTPSQRVHVGTLQTLPDLVTQHAVRAPTLLIVGSVVTLHESLAWYRSGTTDENRNVSHFSGSGI